MRRLGQPRTWIVTLISVFGCHTACAAYAYNMTKGVTEISRGIHQLHMIIFWICVVIGIIVFGVMFYAIIWHRKSRGAQAAHFHENIVVEIIWTIIPLVILTCMAIPASRLLIKMHDAETDSDLSIKITGHHWYWEYEYLGENVRVYSRLATPQIQIHNRDIKGEHYLREVDNPLVIPENKKVRFLTTANDVIHSWWVPAFGVKKDAIPGFINETWARVEKPGIYRGQCAELCGALHGFMPIVVEVKPEAEFQAWLLKQKTPTPLPRGT
jgi:cytochrome c oxidase subunit II